SPAPCGRRRPAGTRAALETAGRRAESAQVMPCRLPLSGLVLAIALVPASPALAQSGGAAAPAGGGTIYEQAAPPPPAQPALRATLFSVAPATVQIGSHLTIAWRVDGPPRRVRARVDLVPTGGGPATHITLGIRRTGQRF